MDSQATPNISPEFIEQNPLFAVALTAFTLVFIGLLVGAIASWIYVIIQLVKGRPILAPELWKPRAWGLVDLIVAAVFILFWQRQSAIVGCSLLGIDRQQLAGEAGIPLPLATILGLGNIAAMLTICLWIGVRHRTTLAQLGFTLRRWWRHIAMGSVAALACLPLVYALMAAVSLGFDNEYSHPLLDEMKRDGSLPAYLLAVTSAVLIAPLIEEFLFRVIIQGWLQSVPFSSLRAIFLGRRETTERAFVTSSADAPTLTAPIFGEYNPYAPVNTIAKQVEAAGAAEETSPVTPPIWPSFVTGTLFGLAHLGYGLSFIPLILLGIILGLLYRATHSIWPSLVVHCVLNGSSMAALGIYILLERATQS